MGTSALLYFGCTPQDGRIYGNEFENTEVI